MAEGRAIVKIGQEDLKDCFLSIPAWDEINKKVGYCRDRIRAEIGIKLPYRGYDKEKCLLSYEEHLEQLGLTFRNNVLVTGVRNLGNNLRIIGWHQDHGLLELKSENATSDRIYTCLCKTKDGKLIIERLSFAKGEPNRDDLIWAVSGQKLVWNGKPNSIEKIIPYTYDLRHVWQIPGTPIEKMGPKPYAGGAVEEMEDAFVGMMNQPAKKMAHYLIKLAEERSYKRDQDYLHNAIGITKENEVVIFHRKASFEKLAEALVESGIWKAIEIQEGGSCGVITKGGKLIFSSDYFRPRALSLLVFLLK